MVISVASNLAAPLTVAVTVITVAPASSLTVFGDKLKVAPVGGLSSSVMVSVLSSGFTTPPPVAVAETVMVLLGLSTELLFAVIVTVPALTVEPVFIIKVLF